MYTLLERPNTHTHNISKHPTPDISVTTETQSGFVFVGTLKNKRHLMRGIIAQVNINFAAGTKQQQHI